MEKNTGLKRIFYAAGYSWMGFRAALAHEAAFRQEFMALLFLGSLSFFLDVSAYERLAMILSLVLLLTIEILNSAVECVVDRIGTEHHVLSGRAKDYASLAVLFGILIVIAVWSVILVN